MSQERLPFRTYATPGVVRTFVACFLTIPLATAAGGYMIASVYELDNTLDFATRCGVAGAIPALAFGVPISGLSWFARDPARVTGRDEDSLLSPTDGRVVAIESTETSIRVDVYLSLFDVHVQRLPCDATVVGLVRHAGRTVDARRAEASRINKRVETRLETAFGPVSVTQVAGKFASRVINVLEPGDAAAAGTSFGMITLGSRVVLEVPAGLEIVAKVGDRVRAGETVVARRVAAVKPESS